ncbi:hypothetical protein BKN38_10025 [Helicobacter sp. CLO-3]|uniref:hypothetical protein n=1 Tax=unclassified Helicobacter TaxID=2593540 RepID=UPI0008057A36|nr:MULTISPECIES: hypothetical protein [unclassified Helicobacter]OBV28895.1 hypothetical protein BA723_07570 [Helicobacter sp. CLO-3]OHU80959.1 hypothetical protein BKN38_10025 [Helicobacter sp. CLO-3]
MGGFKKQPTQPLSSKSISENEFENGGRGESKTKKESKNKGNKVYSVLLPIELIDRLKRYQNREDAKRIETQTYICTQALNAWLDSKGFK